MSAFAELVVAELARGAPRRALNEVRSDDLVAQIRAWQGRFSQAGVGAGQRVVLVAPGSPSWVAAYLGALLAGAVIVPLDTAMMGDDLRARLAFLQPAVTLAGPGQATELGDLPHTLLDAPAAPLPRQPASRPNTPGVVTMVQSSGTGGEPKSIELTDAALLGVLAAYRAELRCRNVLLMLPLSAIYPCIVCMTCLANAIHLELVEAKVESLFVALGRQPFDCLPAVPLVLEQIHAMLLAKHGPPSALARQVRARSGVNLGRRFHAAVHRTFRPRLLLTGGAPLSRAVSRDFFAWGYLIKEGYGLTETCGVVSYTDGSHAGLGSAGRALRDVNLRIAESGEVLVKTPRLMAGYFRNPEATALVVRDGWLHTGDLGHLDRRGRLHLTGRLKEIIVHADERKSSPEEIERRYRGIEGLGRLAVFGVKDPVARYDRVHAAVVPAPDFVASCARPAEARARLRAEVARVAATLPSYLRIEHLHFVEAIPVNNLGKVKRAELERVVGASRAGE